MMFVGMHAMALMVTVMLLILLFGTKRLRDWGQSVLALFAQIRREQPADAECT